MDQSEVKHPADPTREDMPSHLNQLKEQTAKTTMLAIKELYNSSEISPRKFFVITLAAIFVAEVLAMIVIYNIVSLPYWQETLLDAGIMIVIIFPVVYFLLVYPLLLQISQRKRAEDQLARQNQELRDISHAERQQRELAENLVQATIILNASLELDQVLASILEQIRKTIPFQGACIFLLEGSSLHVASCLGYEDFPSDNPPTGKRYAFEEYPLLRQVCASLNPVCVDSLDGHPDWQVVSGLEWAHSLLAVPLLLYREVIGVINLISDRPAAFSQHAVNQLQAFAAPAALALHNANLFNAESSARQVAETLSAAAQALGQSLDLDQVVNTLLEHILMIVKFETAGVTLLEDETRLAVRSLRGYGQYASQDTIPSFPIEGITDSVIYRMISARKSIAIPNEIVTPEMKLWPDLEPIRNWLLVPIIANDNVIGLVELGSINKQSFAQEHIRWAEALVGQAAVAIQNAWLFQQVRASSERLQSLARKLVEIQENERYHIARELHDEAGQVLSSLKLNLGRLEQDPECPPVVQERLRELKDSADGVLEELHRLAMNLRPVALDHLGLVPALEQFAKDMTSDQLRIQFKAIGFGKENLSQEVKISIYRIVQEALTNVVRHAQAGNVGILLEHRDGIIKVFVEDDGVGFSPELFETQSRLGLVGMRERAEMLGGKLSIESPFGEGTSIIVEIPDGDTDTDRG